MFWSRILTKKCLEKNFLHFVCFWFGKHLYWLAPNFGTPLQVVTSEYMIPLQFWKLYKQTKNRHETVSNLSLGKRLTVLSKRLGRKRCCDATPYHCLGSVPSHYLRFALFKKNASSSSKDRGFCLDPRAWSVPNKKLNTPNVYACAVINSLPKVKFSRLERLY